MTSSAITRIPTPSDEPTAALSADAVSYAGVTFTTQIPDRTDGSLELGDIRRQTEQVFHNLSETLEAAGSSLSRLLHLTIYLTDMTDREVFNEVYAACIPKPVPVRCCVAVATLAVEGMRIEITAHAAVEPSADGSSDRR
ncbi:MULTISPECIES: RidA family protein [unclassified Streptomyces]|uniref:RidA family protein n=1 Tax=unclassified Streptomyces TaxID=2593676 RepID=UPI002DD84AE0|nr:MULTISPECIES: RidA family protein [unclassified Streptomyces]WSE00352.1 RidA family protein [Streptomyces sp. NBC_01474]